MTHAVLHILGLGLLGLISFRVFAATDPCAITLKLRQELQITRHVVAVWQLLSQPLWPGFQPQVLSLQLPDSACKWYFQVSHPPVDAQTLPDLEGIWAQVTTPQAQLEPGEPLFCQPVTQAFEHWWLNRWSSPAVTSVQNWEWEQGDWLPEYRALQKALAAASPSMAEEWIRVFLAARALRQRSALQAKQEGFLETLKGLRAWVCMELESKALTGPLPLPVELQYIAPFRTLDQLQARLWQESPQVLSSEEARTRLGLMQILLLARLQPHWKQALMQGRGLTELLAEHVHFSKAEVQRLHPQVTALASTMPMPSLQSDPHSLVVSLELPWHSIELRPQIVQVDSEQDILFLDGSEIRLNHPHVWGVIRGFCRIHSVTGGYVRLQFPLSLHTQLQRSANAQAGCENFRIQTRHIDLVGRCLQIHTSPLQIRIEAK